MPDPAVSDVRENVEEPRPEHASRPRKRASMFDDPIVRVMGFGAIFLIILYLALVAGALVLGVVGSSAPRTAAERQVDQTEAAVQHGDHSGKALADYANALTGVQKYGQAQDVIDSAPSSAKGQPAGDLELAQATLDFMKKDYQQAITSADTAMKVINTAYQADLKKPDLNQSKSYGINANYWSALLVKAMSQQASGDNKGALKSFNEYLGTNAMDSAVFVYRGQVKEQLKDANGAKADFKTALKFDPNYQPALDELKKIGAK